MLLGCEGDVKKPHYQRPEVWMGQDVAIVCDGKCVPVDPQLKREKDIEEDAL